MTSAERSGSAAVRSAVRCNEGLGFSLQEQRLKILIKCLGGFFFAAPDVQDVEEFGSTKNGVDDLDGDVQHPE